jgi:voltage-gated potassium channel
MHLTSSDEPRALGGPSLSYQLFMLVLCVCALVIMLLEAIFRRDAQTLRVLEHADNLICVAFLADFALTLYRAPNRWRYLVTWGWVDLLSSVPALDGARWGRVARIARLSRVFRALRASRALSRMLFRERGQSAALAAALLALFLIVGSSAAILRFEDRAESNIKTADDAMWWAFTTITTVGYGDRFPVTGEGRFIAAILMTAGVGLFGAFSAALAAWFLAPDDQATDAELAGLRAEIAALRQIIEERTQR